MARAIVRDVNEREQAGTRALALMSTAQALTPILAPVLGGYLHVAFGWRSVFYVLAGFGALFVLGALSLVRETNVRRDAAALHPARLAENLRALLGSPAYLGYVAATSLMLCGQFAFIAGSSFVLIGSLGVAPDVYGFCFGSVAVGSWAAASRPLGSRRASGSTGWCSSAPRSAPARTRDGGPRLERCEIGGGRDRPHVLLRHGPRARRAECSGGRGGTVSRTWRASPPRLLGVAQMTGSVVYGIAVGRLSDGTAVPMATAIASAGLAARLCFTFASTQSAPAD